MHVKGGDSSQGDQMSLSKIAQNETQPVFSSKLIHRYVIYTRESTAGSAILNALGKQPPIEQKIRGRCYDHNFLQFW
jgi:hypothetical protein